MLSPHLAFVTQHSQPEYHDANTVLKFFWRPNMLVHFLKACVCRFDVVSWQSQRNATLHLNYEIASATVLNQPPSFCTSPLHQPTHLHFFFGFRHQNKQDANSPWRSTHKHAPMLPLCNSRFSPASAQNYQVCQRMYSLSSPPKRPAGVSVMRDFIPTALPQPQVTLPRPPIPVVSPHTMPTPHTDQSRGHLQLQQGTRA